MDLCAHLEVGDDAGGGLALLHAVDVDVDRAHRDPVLRGHQDLDGALLGQQRDDEDDDRDQERGAAEHDGEPAGARGGRRRGGRGDRDGAQADRRRLVSGRGLGRRGGDRRGRGGTLGGWGA